MDICINYLSFLLEFILELIFNNNNSHEVINSAYGDARMYAYNIFTEYDASAASGISVGGSVIEGMVYGFILGLKSCIMIFIFIWARASFPRIRYDQLMSFC